MLCLCYAMLCYVHPCSSVFNPMLGLRCPCVTQIFEFFCTETVSGHPETAPERSPNGLRTHSNGPGTVSGHSNGPRTAHEDTRTDPERRPMQNSMVSIGPIEGSRFRSFLSYSKMLISSREDEGSVHDRVVETKNLRFRIQAGP